MISIINNTDDNFTSIRAIAEEVWPIAYGSILSQAQLDYMMEMMYSIPSLQQQANEKGNHFIVAIEPMRPGPVPRKPSSSRTRLKVISIRVSTGMTSSGKDGSTATGRSSLLSIFLPNRCLLSSNFPRRISCLVSIANGRWSASRRTRFTTCSRRLQASSLPGSHSKIMRGIFMHTA